MPTSRTACATKTMDAVTEKSPVSAGVTKRASANVEKTLMAITA